MSGAVQVSCSGLGQYKEVFLHCRGAGNANADKLGVLIWVDEMGWQGKGGRNGWQGKWRIWCTGLNPGETETGGRGGKIEALEATYSYTP